MSSASACGGLVPARAILLERLHRDPVEVAAQLRSEARATSARRLLARVAESCAEAASTRCWASAARPRG